jgi:hypothetical protein
MDLVEGVTDFGAERKRLRGTTFGDKRRKANQGRQPLGYQVGNAEGYSIQGDDEDPSGLADWQILSPEAVVRLRQKFPDLRFIPIYDGDIEDAQIIGPDDLR